METFIEARMRRKLFDRVLFGFASLCRGGADSPEGPLRINIAPR